MAIKVSRYCDAGISDALGDRRERHAGCIKVGDVAVAKIVEADLRQAGVAAGLLEPLGEDHPSARSAIRPPG
jgi:hypothetical protein